MSERELTVYSDGLRKAIESIPEELLNMSEEKLTRLVNPSVKQYELKRSFWEELTMAQDAGRAMRNHRIYEGKYSKVYFYQTLLRNKEFMAWVLTPLVEYEDRTKAVLDKAMSRYDELISMEITTTKRVKNEVGDYVIIEETDPKKAAVLFQVIKSLEDRVQGTAIQRQVAVHTDKPSGHGDKAASLSMDKVNERLKELEHKLNPYQEREENDGREDDDSSDRVLETTARTIDKQSDGA